MEMPRSVEACYHLQAVRCVSGKSADELGYNKLNLTVLTGINHGKQSGTDNVFVPVIPLVIVKTTPPIRH